MRLTAPAQLIALRLRLDIVAKPVPCFLVFGNFSEPRISLCQALCSLHTDSRRN